MTAIPPRPPKQPIRWRRALRALRELLADPDDTSKAQELFLAIGDRDFERHLRRFAASPSGQRLLRERPSLPDVLSDRAMLESLPEGSLGREYLAYLDRNGFQPTAIRDLHWKTYARWQRETGAPDVDPVRRWFHDRTLLAHDLFHVLTDYDTDGAGEATLLAFTLPQLGGRANGLLAFGAALELFGSMGFRWLRYDFQAWRRGRRATWLPALAWEELLPLPLETVRNLAGIVPVARAHPDGLLRGGGDVELHFEPA